MSTFSTHICSEYGGEIMQVDIPLSKNCYFSSKRKIVKHSIISGLIHANFKLTHVYFLHILANPIMP